MAAESRVAVVAALLGNVALAVLKATAATFTGSAAMLAETFHSIADTGNQGLLLLGMRLARRPPDERHNFGHARNVYFWAFVVSMALFALGGASAIWDAILTLRHPRFVREHTAWAYGVLAGAFVFESASLTVGVRTIRRARGDVPWSEYIRETRDPTLATVILEDSAALLAIVVAATGVALSDAYRTSFWDAVASAVIGCVLVAVAIFLAAENHSLLLGEAATPRMQATIRRVVRDDPDVVELVDLRTLHLGPETVAIVLGVAFRDGLVLADVERAVERLEERIRDAIGPVTNRSLVVVEPTRRTAADTAA